jgi:hypothetical protein
MSAEEIEKPVMVILSCVVVIQIKIFLFRMGNY